MISNSSITYLIITIYPIQYYSYTLYQIIRESLKDGHILIQLVWFILIINNADFSGGKEI